ncbi:MAG TPA: hypothetical protein ENI37_07170 [Chloroflexi bacterium]|nr:hypothetical protein [Chloroflexota bacterium]
MARRSSSKQRTSRRVLEIRAPRRGTVIVAAVLYVVGLFGYLGWFRLGRDLSMGAMAMAGGLLLLGALLHDL